MFEAVAKAQFVRGSAQKKRLVIDQIRGKGVLEALEMLRHSPKRASGDIEKVLRSAVANAMAKDELISEQDLIISKCYVDGGPIYKRIRPTTMGRAFRIRKRNSHITIFVGKKG